MQPTLNLIEVSINNIENVSHGCVSDYLAMKILFIIRQYIYHYKKYVICKSAKIVRKQAVIQNLNVKIKFHEDILSTL